MSWASAAIQFWCWALALAAEGVFLQEGIASAVRDCAEAEISRHTSVLTPTPEHNPPRYGPPPDFKGQPV